MKSNKLLKCLLGAFSALLASIVFLITFVDSNYIPSWKDIFGIYEEIDPLADIITFIDVGQGDCVLLQSNGRFALVDTGTDNNGVVRTLKRKGIAGFDALIISHWHSDHCGSSKDIINNFEVANMVFSYASKNDSQAIENFENVKNICINKDIEINIAVEGMVVYLGDIELTILYCNNESDNENDRSLVIMAECRGRKVLLTGDIETTTENNIINSGINIDCDVLKIAHHGSDTSSDIEFLKACSPNYAVISVGKDNSYGHPDRKTINALYENDVIIYRTDYDGDVCVTFENSDVKITTRY